MQILNGLVVDSESDQTMSFLTNLCNGYGIKPPSSSKMEDVKCVVQNLLDYLNHAEITDVGASVAKMMLESDLNQITLAQTSRYH